MAEIPATIKAKANPPRSSPVPPLDLIEKKRTTGMMITPTKLPPTVEPIRAKVAVFSRYSESKEIAGIIDQKATSLNE